jgi:hypothetical protein
LTRALLALDEGYERRQPAIHPRWDEDPSRRMIYLRAGKDLPRQSIIVRGTDLWRNPVVFLGTQKATSLEVLPDMRGLVAHFDQVQLPASPDLKEAAVLDLTIVTSGGDRSGRRRSPCCRQGRPSRPSPRRRC